MATAVAAPASAREPADGRLDRAEFIARFERADEQNRPPLRFEVTDRLTVRISGGKAKSLGESHGRRPAEGPAGRSASSKAARVGVSFRW